MSNNQVPFAKVLNVPLQPLDTDMIRKIQSHLTEGTATVQMNLMTDPVDVASWDEILDDEEKEAETACATCVRILKAFAETNGVKTDSAEVVRDKRKRRAAVKKEHEQHIMDDVLNHARYECEWPDPSLQAVEWKKAMAASRKRRLWRWSSSSRA